MADIRPFFFPMATGGDDFNVSCWYLDLGGGFKSFFAFIPKFWREFFSNLTFRIFWTTGLVVQPPTDRNVDLPVPKTHSKTGQQQRRWPISQSANQLCDFRRRQDVNQGEDFENWRYDVALEVGWFVGVGWFGWGSQQRNGRKNAWNLREWMDELFKDLRSYSLSCFSEKISWGVGSVLR